MNLGTKHQGINRHIQKNSQIELKKKYTHCF